MVIGPCFRRDDVPPEYRACDLNPPTPRHDRGTEQDDDDGEKLAVNDHGDQSQLLRANGGHLPGLHRLTPRQKFDRRYDRQQTNHDKDGELGENA